MNDDIESTLRTQCWRDPPPEFFERVLSTALEEARQRPGVRRSSGAFECLPAHSKSHGATAPHRTQRLLALLAFIPHPLRLPLAACWLLAFFFRITTPEAIPQSTLDSYAKLPPMTPAQFLANLKQVEQLADELSHPSTTAPSRHSSVRFSRWIARLVWNSRMGWTLVCLASLLTLYYQWENWRSARELKAAHQRMIERIGTDDWIAFAASSVPDEQNIFAMPVVEQWLHRDKEPVHYIIPQGTFMPSGFVKPVIIENGVDKTSHINFSAWALGRDLKGDEPAVVMNRELGDGNGLLPKLAAGLARPFSAWKPAQREELIVAGANPYTASQPHLSNVNDTMRDLGLHLRVAAAAGDVKKTRSTALILLRLFPESATSYHWLLGSLVSTATHGLAFEAIQDALSHSAWEEDGLRMLQLQLGKIDDLEVLERVMSMEVLTGFGSGIYIRERCGKGWAATEDLHFSREDGSWLKPTGGTATRLGYVYGPTGWHDANIAFYAETYLDMLGPKGESAWMDGRARGEMLKKRRDEEYRQIDWNMRRKIGALALPNIGNLFSAAAETLFRRRCLIIACALEKHRMKHGIFPASLEAVKDELKLFNITDPARPAMLPGYRLESNGYLLWSVGPDAKDDGGAKDKDWFWRMKRAP
jgi:hypothetical protein